MWLLLLVIIFNVVQAEESRVVQGPSRADQAKTVDYLRWLCAIWMSIVCMTSVVVLLCVKCRKRPTVIAEDSLLQEERQLRANAAASNERMREANARRQIEMDSMIAKGKQSASAPVVTRANQSTTGTMEMEKQSASAPVVTVANQSTTGTMDNRTRATNADQSVVTASNTLMADNTSGNVEQSVVITGNQSTVVVSDNCTDVDARRQENQSTAEENPPNVGRVDDNSIVTLDGSTNVAVEKQMGLTSHDTADSNPLATTPSFNGPMVSKKTFLFLLLLICFPKIPSIAFPTDSKMFVSKAYNSVIKSDSLEEMWSRGEIRAIVSNVTDIGKVRLFLICDSNHLDTQHHKLHGKACAVLKGASNICLFEGFV
jgi:hypothetical protein